MKKKFVFATCILLLSPIYAYAVHHLVFVSKIIRISNTSCAIELKLSANDQNEFVVDDQIKINNIELVDLTNAINAGINDPSGNNDDGDTILAASNSFVISQGINADLPFSDANCANIDSNATIGFFIDRNTEVDSIDTFLFNLFGDDNTALIKTSSSSTPQVIDLSDQSLDITNNQGVSASVGTGSPNPNNSGSANNPTTALTCALNPKNFLPFSLMLWFVIAYLGLFSFIRFR